MSEEQKRGVLSDTVWTPERGMNESQPSPEMRSIAWNNFLFSDESYSGRWRTSAEVRVTPETALESTCVLAACRILAETIAGLPVHVYRRKPNGERELATDVPLNKVLTFAPNAWQTKFEFFEQLMMTLTLWGNNYTLIKSGKFGSVSEMSNLHPSRMDVERLENGRLRYNYTDPETGKYERYSQDEIMHIRWTPEPDGIKGMVPVEIAREAIALARACEIHASKYWANSARPGIVLTTDGTLGAEQAERLRDNWERLHKGVDRAYKTAVLTNGLKPEQIGFTAEQSQFIDSRRFQCEEIARVYRLPLHLIQGTPGGSLEVQGQEFITYTLLPWLKRIESAISRSLIWNDDLFFAEFDTRGLLRADSNSRASYYSTMMGLGILSVNEIRRLENLPSLGEKGDTHFIAMNVQPLEEAGKPKQDPMAAMMGGGAPPPKEKGVPSLPGVQTGEAPKEMPKGEESVKEVDAVEVEEEEEGKEESRSANCGRESGGKFGKGNDCAAGEGGPKTEKKKASDFPEKIKAGADILKKWVPFRPVQGTKNSEFAKPVSDEKLKEAIQSNKKDKVGAARELDEGSPVALRIDIPTFTRKGVYAVTVHESTSSGFKPSPVGYDSVARLSGPVTFESKEKQAVLVASGNSSKFPLATVKGKYSKDRTIPKDIDSWTAVGYDPQKAGFFYDKATGQEVKGGTDSISVGNSVFVRIPKYGDRKAQKQYREANFWGTETRSLPPKKEAVYSAMTDSAKKNGKWSQEEAAYTPNSETTRRCLGCIFFDSTECEIVASPIVADGVCRYHESGDGGESRDCGRDDDGQFGSNNTCAAEDGSSSESKPKSSSGSKSKPDASTFDVAKLLKTISANPSGFTISPQNAQQPDSGIMVSEFRNDDKKRSTQIKEKDIKSPEVAAKFKEWLASNDDAFKGRDDRYMGGWSSDGTFYIDVATRFDEKDAEKALDAGRKSGQLAVFNLGTFKETWVKYKDKDGNKPEGYDNAFNAARKSAAIEQVYDPDAPSMDEEDWAKELSDHGEKTVRSLLARLLASEYNFDEAEMRTILQAFQTIKGKSNERREEASGAVRHPSGRGQAGSVQSVPEVRGADSQEERQEAGPSLVQGLERGRSGTLLEESRDDCGRNPSGQFGTGNDCAADGKSPQGDGKQDLLSTLSKAFSTTIKKEELKNYSGADKLSHVSSVGPAKSTLESMGLSNVASILAAGAGNIRDSSVHLDFEDDEYGDLKSSIGVASSIPLTPESDDDSDPDDRTAATRININKYEDGDLEVEWNVFSVGKNIASLDDKTRYKVASVMSEHALSSAKAAEEMGADRIALDAAGSAGDNVFQGYRIWPQFGFDGPLPSRELQDSIPDEIIPKSVKDRGDVTIQQLVATPEGKQWWAKNGKPTKMTLDFSKKDSTGYKKFQQKLKLLDVLRKRNEKRDSSVEAFELFDFLDTVIEFREDCGRQEGGRFGTGNDCAAEDGSGSTATKEKTSKKKTKTTEKTSKPSGLKWSKGDKVRNVVQDAIDNPPTKLSSDGKKIDSTFVDDKDVYSFAGREWVSTTKAGELLTAKQGEDRGATINTAVKELGENEYDYLVESIASQAENAMKRGISAKFYSPEERSAQIEEFSKIIPQVKGGKTKDGQTIEAEDAEHLFRSVQALTSPNASPFSNMQRTDSLLNKFFNDDTDLRTSTKLGVTGPGIQKSLSRYMSVVERLGKRTDGSVDIGEGLKKTRELFNGTVLDSNEAEALFNDLMGKEAGKDFRPKNYVVSEKVPLFSVFGPKVGPFYANNNGETDHLTADVWWTRTWGRTSGELVVPPSATAGAKRASEISAVLGRAKPEALHGIDKNVLKESIKKMKKTGEPDDVIKEWSKARLRSFANGGFKDKTGTVGKLNRAAKGIVENDWSLMGDPGAGTRRSNMIKVARDAAKRVGQPAAYMQDILWQDEQDAYAALGAKTVTGLGDLSLYSDVIRGIAGDSKNRRPMAARVNKRSRDPEKNKVAPYDDYDRGGREQLLFDEAVSKVSDEDFVNILLKYASKKEESRSTDCGRQEGGQFGKGNDCASDGSEGSSEEPSKKSPFGKDEQDWGSRRETEVWYPAKPLFAGAENLGKITLSNASDLKQQLGDNLKMSLPEAVMASGVPLFSSRDNENSGKPELKIYPLRNGLQAEWSITGAATGEGYSKENQDMREEKDGDPVVAAMANRAVSKTKQGLNHLSLENLIVHPDFQKKGFATEAVVRSTSSPVDSIAMFAAREDSEDPKFRLVGYKVWPKFGYNASISRVRDAIDKSYEYKAMTEGKDLDFAASLIQEADDELSKIMGGSTPRSLLDIFAKKGGEAWWGKHGSDISLSFDTAPRSQSRLVRDDYLASKRKKKRSEQEMATDENASDWDATEEDKSALDSVWKKYQESGLPGEADIERLEEAARNEEERKENGDS